MTTHYRKHDCFNCKHESEPLTNDVCFPCVINKETNEPTMWEPKEGAVKDETGTMV